MPSPPSASTSSAMTRHCPVSFSLSPGCCILGALALLILPLGPLLAALCAATIHEFCHLLALRLCSVPVLQIRVGIGSAVIRTAPLSPPQELLCALAGPAGSLACLLLARLVPLLALFGLIQGLYNLLPIYPLDGGRIFRAAVLMIRPQWSPFLPNLIGYLAVVLVICGSLFLFLQTCDGIFCLISVYFWFKISLPRKTPCKDGCF